MTTSFFRRFMQNFVLINIACATSGIALWAGAIIDIGKGAYTTEPPAGMKLPPRHIFKTDAVKGAMQTTDWWSSLAWKDFSQNHFPHPLAVKAEKRGLFVSYPGAFQNTVSKHVISGVPENLVLGHSEVSAFTKADVDGFSDWFVSVLFKDGNRQMRVTYGHGSPFVFAEYQGGSPAICRKGDFNVWHGARGGPILGITVQGCHYGLFGPSGSSWDGLDTNKLVNRSQGQSYFSLALLPDKNLATLDTFAAHAHNHVKDTKVEWVYDPAAQAVKTTFSYILHSYEKSRHGTIFALYPHQWLALATNKKLLQGAYKSVRGPMKTGAGTSFTTVHPFCGILPSLPLSKNCDRKRLEGQLALAMKKRLPDPEDTYWHGKTLGTLVNLIATAEQLGKTRDALQLRERLSNRLETWFTVSSPESSRSRYFYYDKTWSTLIGHKPSYGSSGHLNDHHFHYGYFIRAAADLARTNPEWAAPQAWGGMVELLINDIACPDRNHAMFPFLRCFDPYAGHSWASGDANFADGNNQESCSESMNAWTGIMLWGEATGNRELRDLGIYLYATELAAINAYWFDVHDRFFPAAYKQSCAALVWGAKTDFATWFSGEPEHVHGIIMLPIQSGSLYMGVYPGYVRTNLDSCAKLRGSYTWKDWAGVLLAYEALADGEKALERFNLQEAAVKDHLRPFTYHWITTLSAFGNLDSTVKADCPTAMAFVKNGKRTYVAYNMSRKTLIVRFSDKTRINVKPGSFMVK